MSIRSIVSFDAERPTPGILHPGQSIPDFLTPVINTDEFTLLYNNSFNCYSWHLTISPKSTPLFKNNNKKNCKWCNCSCSSDVHTKKQYDILLDLHTAIVKKFDIDMLTVIESYKDNVNLHTHSILNFPFKIKNELYDFIKDYLKLDKDGKKNRKAIKLTDINSFDAYRDYLLKDTFEEFYNTPHYYLSESSEQLRKDNIEKQLREKKRIEERDKEAETALIFAMKDEFHEHLYRCNRKKCKLCTLCKREINDMDLCRLMLIKNKYNFC